MIHLSKQAPVIAVATALLFGTVGPASAFYGLVVGETGQPSTNFFIEDNDATDQNATSGTISFSSTCTACPAPLAIGNYSINNIFSTVKHVGSIGVELSVHIMASTNSTTPTGLTVQASANDLIPRLRGVPGTINSTYSTASGKASSANAGNIPTSISWDSWANASNTPFNQEQLVASLAVQSTDFSNVGNMFEASVYSRNPYVNIGRGDPIAITQTFTINTDSPGEFAASGETTVAPVPGALPLMASAFAAMAFLRIRRRATA